MSKPPPVHRLLHIMTIKANVEAVLQALFPFKHAFPIVLLTHAVLGSSYVLRCLFCFPLSYYQTLIWSYFLRWGLAVESYRMDNKSKVMSANSFMWHTLVKSEHCRSRVLDYNWNTLKMLFQFFCVNYAPLLEKGKIDLVWIGIFFSCLLALFYSISLCNFFFDYSKYRK